MRGDIHVVPNDTIWAIAIEGTGTRTRYDTLEEAVAIAKKLAGVARVELLIHAPDGKISEHVTFGYPR